MSQEILETQNQESESEVNQDQCLPVPGSPDISSLSGQDQTMQNNLKIELIEERMRNCTQQDQNQLTMSGSTHAQSCEIEGSIRDLTQQDWVISIREKLKQANRDDDKTRWSKLCIYKVPPYLHKNNNSNSYSPQTVSLGPYHRGKSQTYAMECHKWRAVNQILQRRKQDIDMYIHAMKELEDKARACYEGPIGLTSNEFTEMLLLDGCFVLEILMGADKGFSELGYDLNDPVFAIRGSMHSIQLDMIMMENQLPLFVLKRLLKLQLGAQYQPDLVAQLAVRFFDSLMPMANIFSDKKRGVFKKTVISQSSNLGKLHCLDVIRRKILFPKVEKSLSEKERFWDSRVADKRRQQLISSVTELRDAGFKFRRRDADYVWDIKFENGYLEIPRLFIHEGTKSLFLNLIAFEECHIQSNNNITTYVIFMDNLINTCEDVTYLHQCGIIEHTLGSDSEVADMFNQLCQEVGFNVYGIYLSELLNEVHEYHKKKYFRKWNAWKTTLIHNYFDNPWAYISFLAAFILLVLTSVQSFFAVYAYFKPP